MSTNSDSTGAMAHAWFGTPMGKSQAVERTFPSKPAEPTTAQLTAGVIALSQAADVPLYGAKLVRAVWQAMQGAAS